MGSALPHAPTPSAASRDQDVPQYEHGFYPEGCPPQQPKACTAYTRETRRPAPLTLAGRSARCPAMAAGSCNSACRKRQSSSPHTTIPPQDRVRGPASTQAQDRSQHAQQSLARSMLEIPLSFECCSSWNPSSPNTHAPRYPVLARNSDSRRARDTSGSRFRR